MIVVFMDDNDESKNLCNGKQTRIVKSHKNFCFEGRALLFRGRCLENDGESDLL